MTSWLDGGERLLRVQVKYVGRQPWDCRGAVSLDFRKGGKRNRTYLDDEIDAVVALRWIDLPLDQVRIILQDPVGEHTRATLAAHRDRLSRQASALAARIADTEYYIEKGISMAPVSGTHPVQLKIAVDDVDSAIAFYQQAFGFHYDVTRRTEECDYSSFVFSKYGERDFFLLHLLADPTQSDRPGPTTFGLSVEDLADSHKRALAAGAIEMCSPHDAEGMPRCSAVRDPSGNWIWLYQG